MLWKVLIDKVLNRVDQALSGKKKKKKKKEDELSHFASTVCWNVLSREDTAVEEPLNPALKNAIASTILEEDSNYVPVKHAFARIFD